MPTDDVQQQDVQDQQDQTTDQTQDANSNSTPAQQTPAPTDLNWRELYLDSQQARIRSDSELARVQREANERQTQQAQPVTTRPTIPEGNEWVAQTIEHSNQQLRNELTNMLGDIAPIGKQWKKQQQINEAEQTVFGTMQQLAPFREQLAPEIRRVLGNVDNVDPSVYATALSSVVGQFAIRNMLNVPSSAAPTPVPNTPTPAPRTNGLPPAGPNTPTRVTEAERKAMIRGGLDPAKKEDIAKFVEITQANVGSVSV